MYSSSVSFIQGRNACHFSFIWKHYYDGCFWLRHSFYVISFYGFDNFMSNKGLKNYFYCFLIAFSDSAKLSTLSTRMPTCLEGWRANVLTCQGAFCAYVPFAITCQRVLRTYVPRCLCAYVLTYQCVLRAYVLTYQQVLRAYMLTCHLPCVPTCSCVNVHCVSKCSSVIISNNKKSFQWHVFLRFLALYLRLSPMK